MMMAACKELAQCQKEISLLKAEALAQGRSSEDSESERERGRISMGVRKDISERTT